MSGAPPRQRAEQIASKAIVRSINA